MSGRRGRFQKKNRFTRTDNKPNKDYSIQEQLCEADVGITEYLSNLEGFSAVIKQRYSDFHVSEINLYGEVAKLTDTKIPKDFHMKEATSDYREITESPLKHIPQEKWESMKKLVEAKQGEPVLIDASNFDKDARSEVHNCVKNYFGRKIVASTVERDGVKYIEIRKFDQNNRDDSHRQWPKDKGEYVHFILYKESLDTMDAILKMSDLTRVPPSAFSYAGVKDRRAKTTQWCSVRRVEPWKLISKVNSQRNIKVGNLTFKDEPLMLGQLKANRFKIALRNVMASDDLIEKSMKFVEENGFINYFGLQRFGNDKEVPTYIIGVKLLLGLWKEACDLILKPKSSEDPSSDIFIAKKVYAETGDAAKAFESLTRSKHKTIEGRLLEGIKNANHNDFTSALEKIPRYTRLLYMNGFQSLIWNRMVSLRIKLFGLKPVVGDLVLIEKSEDSVIQDLDELKPDKKEDMENGGNSEHMDDESKSEDQKDENKNNGDNTEEEEQLKYTTYNKVKVLEENDLPNYTIYDIVLPFPGYGVRYPEHMKQHYKEAIEEFGLNLEMKMHNFKQYSSCGSYRHILKSLENFSWKILLYNDPKDNLIRSDFEELKGDPEPKSVELGHYKALVMYFDLPPAGYATMVLREVLKSNTSTSAQAKLNNYHEERKKTISIEADNDDSSINQNSSEAGAQGSLLSNPEKYAQFKDSIFKDILGPKKAEGESEAKKAKIEETS